MTYPTIRPELTLDFANSRQLDPRITFSRSSSATYLNPDTGLITTASDHEARFEKEGLLVEESRTNEIPYSEDFTHSSWTNVNVTVTSNNTTAPDGTLNAADRLQIGATNGVIYNNTVGGVTSNSTISVWIKAVSPGTSDVFRLGSAGSLSADITATNQWTRYTYTSTTFTSSLHGIVRPSDNTAADIYVWGAQFEENKTFPTSYIPTAGSTITRAADIAQMASDNFSSWYNQSEGTFAFEYNTPNQLSDNALGVWGAKSTNNAARVEFYTGNSGSGAVTFDTPSGRSFQFLTRAQAVSGKYALALKQDSFALSQNGNDALTDNSGDMNSTNQMGVLALGSTNNVNNQLCGHISRLSYYPRRLTDSELQTITL